MKIYAHKIGATFYILWGILHIVGGASLLQQLSAEGAIGALASLGSAVPTAELPIIPGGVVEAVLAFFSWNWVWIGVLVSVVGFKLNWHNNRIGYWLNISIAGSADLGLIVTLLAPGYMAVSDGWPGPLLWLVAAIFSTIGAMNQDPEQAVQVSPKEKSPSPSSYS